MMRAWVSVSLLSGRWHVSRETIRLRIVKDQIETRRGLIPLSVAQRWDAEVSVEAKKKRRLLEQIIQSIEADALEDFSKEMP